MWEYVEKINENAIVQRPRPIIAEGLPQGSSCSLMHLSKCEIKHRTLTQAQFTLTKYEQYLKETDIESYDIFKDAIDTAAATEQCGSVVLTRDEVLILQKLLRGIVVGPPARKVLAKINAVKGN